MAYTSVFALYIWIINKKFNWHMMHAFIQVYFVIISFTYNYNTEATIIVIFKYRSVQYISMILNKYYNISFTHLSNAIFRF